MTQLARQQPERGLARITLPCSTAGTRICADHADTAGFPLPAGRDLLDSPPGIVGRCGGEISAPDHSKPLRLLVPRTAPPRSSAPPRDTTLRADGLDAVIPSAVEGSAPRLECRSLDSLALARDDRGASLARDDTRTNLAVEAIRQCPRDPRQSAFPLFQRDRANPRPAATSVPSPANRPLDLDRRPCGDLGIGFFVPTRSPLGLARSAVQVQTPRRRSTCRWSIHRPVLTAAMSAVRIPRLAWHPHRIVR